MTYSPKLALLLLQFGFGTALSPILHPETTLIQPHPSCNPETMLTSGTPPAPLEPLLTNRIPPY